MKSKDPLPRRALVRLKWVDTTLALPITALGSTYAQYFQFHPMNVNQPNAPTGIQPYGHDTYQALMTRFKVWKTSYRIEVLPSSGGSGNYYTNLQATNIALVAAPTKASQDMLPGAITKMGGVFEQHKIVYKGAIDHPRVLGISRREFATNSAYSGVLDAIGVPASDPIVQDVLFLGIASDVAATVSVKTTLIFHCEMTRPNQAVAS